MDSGVLGWCSNQRPVADNSLLDVVWSFPGSFYTNWHRLQIAFNLQEVTDAAL